MNGSCAQVLREIAICRAGDEPLRIDNFDDVAVDVLTGALQVGRRQVRAFDAHPQPPHVARIVNGRKRRRAPFNSGNDR